MVDACKAPTENSPLEPSGRTVNSPVQSSRSPALLSALKRYLFSNFCAVRKSVRSNSIGFSTVETVSPRLRSSNWTLPPCMPSAAMRTAGNSLEAGSGCAGFAGASFARLSEPSRATSTGTTGGARRTPVARETPRPKARGAARAGAAHGCLDAQQIKARDRSRVSLGERELMDLDRKGEGVEAELTDRGVPAAQILAR